MLYMPLEGSPGQNSAPRRLCPGIQQLTAPVWGLCSELFEMLAPLEERTRPLTTAARVALAASKGQDALEPWNLSYALSGAPFSSAPLRGSLTAARAGCDA